MLKSHPAHGIGVDYDAAFIATATTNTALTPLTISWLIYDFNLNANDIVTQLISTHHVTHVFVYLTPKQLELPTVREILTRLCGEGVMVCCHKFFPAYLTASRRDKVMELNVYDGTSY